MQRRAQRRHIAELGIAEHGGDREAGGAHLPQQPQSMAPFLLKLDRRRNPRPLALGGCQPRVREIQRCAQTPRANAGPERHRRGDLAIGDLAQRAAVLSGRADRRRTLLGKTGAVENQDAAAFGNDRAQATPDPLGVPRGMRDEMLKRLVRDRLGDARQHRLHRLALAVAEDPLHIGPQRQQLRAMAKAAFELLQPPDEALNPRGRRAIDHCAAPYQMMTKSTMSSIQITGETRTHLTI